MSTWGSKHLEENNILWINNNQCIELVINIYIYTYIYPTAGRVPPPPYVVISPSCVLSTTVVACQYTAHAVYRQATTNSHREWHYHMLHVYNSILLKMSTWGSKHVEENNILWINNNQCIEMVINIYIYIFILLLDESPPPSLSVRVVYCQPPRQNCFKMAILKFVKAKIFFHSCRTMIILEWRTHW